MIGITIRDPDSDCVKLPYYHCETLLWICYHGIEGSSVIIPVIPSTLLMSGI